MKWLWTKTRELADDWFNLFAIGVIAAAALIGIYTQQTLQENRLKAITDQYNKTIELKNEEMNQVLKAGNALYKNYQKQQLEFNFQNSIIEKQQEIIKKLLLEIKRLEEIRKWDPDKIA